jgi:hypothetical protein
MYIVDATLDNIKVGQTIVAGSSIIEPTEWEVIEVLPHGIRLRCLSRFSGSYKAGSYKAGQLAFFGKTKFLGMKPYFYQSLGCNQEW